MDVLILLIIFLVLPAILILKILDKRNPERKKTKFFDTSDLKIFGWKPNPWVAVILGASTYLIGGNLGGSLQPIGLLMIVFGGVKIVSGLIRRGEPQK